MALLAKVSGEIALSFTMLQVQVLVVLAYIVYTAVILL
jgi:hypothetical protein